VFITIYKIQVKNLLRGRGQLRDEGVDLFNIDPGDSEIKICMLSIVIIIFNVLDGLLMNFLFLILIDQSVDHDSADPGLKWFSRIVFFEIR
jgi:hypothetical protein